MNALIRLMVLVMGLYARHHHHHHHSFNNMMIHKSRGGIMVLIVMLVAILAILLPVWLSVAALQRKVVADQEQVERSSQISEAGIQYIVFLLNNEACTIYDLVGNKNGRGAGRGR